VARLMRAAGLEGRRKKRWRTTTIADPAADRARDLIQRDFAPRPGADRRYAGDITYIMTWEGWAYLATVTGLSSRRVVGWALADHMRTELVEDALSMAFAQRRPPSGTIFRSDRGCQYTSTDYAALARAHGVILSVSRKGECWDNAVAESFFATIKREVINDRPGPRGPGCTGPSSTPDRRHDQLKKPVCQSGSSLVPPGSGHCITIQLECCDHR
jgi:transposase InsO family protein